jgi:hypothetical protein
VTPKKSTRHAASQVAFQNRLDKEKPGKQRLYFSKESSTPVVKVGPSSPLSATPNFTCKKNWKKEVIKTEKVGQNFST